MYRIGIALVSHWYRIGIASVSHRYHIGIALVSHWYRIGIALVLLHVVFILELDVRSYDCEETRVHHVNDT